MWAEVREFGVTTAFPHESGAERLDPVILDQKENLLKLGLLKNSMTD